MLVPTYLQGLLTEASPTWCTLPTKHSTKLPEMPCFPSIWGIAVAWPRFQADSTRHVNAVAPVSPGFGPTKPHKGPWSVARYAHNCTYIPLHSAAETCTHVHADMHRYTCRLKCSTQTGSTRREAQLQEATKPLLLLPLLQLPLLLTGTHSMA